MSFNGTCNGPDFQARPISFRYHGVYLDGVDAYAAFKTLDDLKPGDEIDYETWQKLMVAARLLAKKYNWFEFIDPGSPNAWKPEMRWNEETEEYDLVSERIDGAVWDEEKHAYIKK